MSNRHHAKALNGRPRAEAIEFSIGIWQATQSEEKLIRTQQWKLLLSQTAVPFLLHFHAADLIAGRTQGLAAAKKMCPKQASVTSTCHNTQQPILRGPSIFTAKISSSSNRHRGLSFSCL
jgi:hypothetical protein